MVYLGEIGEVSRRVPTLLSAALEQGNVFAATDLRTRLNLIWLAADDPDRARAEAIEALKAWPHEGFHLQHYSAMLALAQIELYTGDTEVVWRHLQGQWQALEDSLLLRIQVLRIEAMHLQARAALATSEAGKDRLNASRTKRPPGPHPSPVWCAPDLPAVTVTGRRPQSCCQKLPQCSRDRTWNFMRQRAGAGWEKSWAEIMVTSSSPRRVPGWRARELRIPTR